MAEKIIMLLFALLALLLGGCGRSETEKFYESTYGELVICDESGTLSWSDSGEEIEACWSEARMYRGQFLEMRYKDVRSLPLLGTVLRYELKYNRNGIGWRDNYPLDENAEPKLYRPELQVLIEEKWWPVRVNEADGMSEGVWFNLGSNTFMFSMDAYGSGECLPAGNYRLVLTLPEEEVSIYGIVDPEIYLCFNFEHSPELIVRGGSMADTYPETWETMRRTYGDCFTIDDNGEFIWNVGGGFDSKPYVDETEYLPYEGENIWAEYDGKVEIAGAKTTKIRFKIYNNSGEIIEIPDEPFALQICLDGCWWEFDCDYKANIKGKSFALENTISKVWPIRLWRGSSGFLPNGLYRFICQLPDEYGGKQIVCELELHL